MFLTQHLASTSRKRIVAQLPVLDFLAPCIAGTSKHSISQTHGLFRTGSSTQSKCVSTTPLTENRPPISVLSDISVLGNYEFLDIRGDPILKAASENDLFGVWKSYCALPKMKRVLGPPQFNQISRMINSIIRNKDHSYEWTAEERKAIEELSVICATGGYIGCLRQIMLHDLRKRDTSSVLKLYDQYCTVSSQENIGFVQNGLASSSKDYFEKEDADEEHGWGESEETEEDSFRNASKESPIAVRMEADQVNVSYMLVVVLAAYALRNQWEGALAAGLKHGVHITTMQVKSTFNELKKCNDFYKQTAMYCESINLASLVHRQRALNKHIRNLAREKNISNIEGLEMRIRRGLTDTLKWATIGKEGQSPSNLVRISDKVWGFFLHTYILLRREDLAERLWTRVRSMGVNPGVDMWDALMEGYRETAQTEKVWNTWAGMIEAGVKPNAGCYAARITTLFDSRAKGAALKAFEEFKMAIPKSEDSLFVWNAMLTRLLSKGDLKEATALFEEMKGTGPSPNIVSFNIWLQYYGKKQDITMVLECLQRLTDSNLKPDVVTFTTILSTLLKREVPKATEQLLDIMNKMGVEQNVATYSAIITAQVRQGTAEGIRSAWEILQKMETMRHAQPNEITYMTFIHGVHLSKELDSESAMSMMDTILARMTKRGFRVRRAAYHSLIKSYLDNGTPRGLKLFTQLYNRMVQEDVKFSHDTWYLILRGLLSRSEWELASKMVDDMLESGFKPMWAVQSMTMHVLHWRKSK